MTRSIKVLSFLFILGILINIPGIFESEDEIVTKNLQKENNKKVTDSIKKLVAESKKGIVERDIVLIKEELRDYEIAKVELVDNELVIDFVEREIPSFENNLEFNNRDELISLINGNSQLPFVSEEDQEIIDSLKIDMLVTAQN